MKNISELSNDELTRRIRFCDRLIGFCLGVVMVAFVTGLTILIIWS